MKNKVFLVFATFLFLFSVSAESATASVGVKNVNIYYNNIKINADGSYVNTVNEPFTISGVTYVPLREIGNILNAEVRWDAENNIIFIKSSNNLAVSADSNVKASTSIGTKSVSIHYNNIKINADGKYVNTINEPFTINGVTYVPLREISNILSAEVAWDAKNNTVLIMSNSKDEPVDSEEPNNEPNDNSEPEDTVDEPVVTEPKDENTLFVELLFDKHGTLKDVGFDKFMLDGDKKKVSFDIYLDLSSNVDTWNALTDRNISNWLNDIATDIQKKFNKDTKITGKIVRTSNRNVLMDFTKDGDTSLKTSFYDASYRTGVETKTTTKPVDNKHFSKHYYVDKLDFITTAATYNETFGSLDIVLNATKENTKYDWDRFSTREKNAYVMVVLDEVIDDFAGEYNMKQINLNFKDKSNKQIALYRYDVNAEKFIK
jgi:hypothetical protein